MRQQVQFTGTAAEASRLLAALPLIVAGTHPDPHGLARMVQLRGGNALLSQVYQDFLRKSRGERGRDGIVWPPLQPETIAYGRRTTRGERKALGIREKGHRRSLTPDQNRRWGAIFARVSAEAMADGLSEAEAKAKGGAVAWAKLKEDGAHTLLELLGNRKVDMCRDTGEYLRSLAAGVDDKKNPNAPDQVFETPPGRIIVGTKNKPWLHTGDAKRGIPARPLWPLDGSIPDAWMPAVSRAIVNGIAAVVAFLLAGQRTNPQGAT